MFWVLFVGATECALCRGWSLLAARLPDLLLLLRFLDLAELRVVYRFKIKLTWWCLASAVWIWRWFHEYADSLNGLLSWVLEHTLPIWRHFNLNLAFFRDEDSTLVNLHKFVWNVWWHPRHEVYFSSYLFGFGCLSSLVDVSSLGLLVFLLIFHCFYGHMLLNSFLLLVCFDICRKFRTIRFFPHNFSSFISLTLLSLLSNVAAEHEGQRDKDESNDESHMTQVLCPGRVKCVCFIDVWLCYFIDEPVDGHHDAIGPLLLPPNLVFCMREVSIITKC